jgi:hypothetical protein
MANRFAGKAASDSPALKPYWGKPAVRNFRGGDGNVGIIRSPVRAIALPDWRELTGQMFDYRALMRKDRCKQFGPVNSTYSSVTYR